MNTVHSGKYKLLKITKSDVKRAIKAEGCFKGFMCGNKVNPHHIADGWHLGLEFTTTSIDDFEKQVEEFTTGLIIYTPELGRYAHYYQIVGVCNK